MRRSARYAALLLGTSWLLPAAAQQPPVFRSRVDLVDVAVVVRDSSGRLVPDLTVADFEVIDNGVPQRLTAFGHVTMPVARGDPPRAPAASVPADVASNESAGHGRVFVLVLDALHVSPQSVLAVRRVARQFIERNVGPRDFAAVLSPGAVAEATQDFTTDTPRLLAAVDRFVGTKLRSATLEIENERRSAILGGVMMHGGRDPSDQERADRVRSLTSVLEALAQHLERVERRRKTLLLFSEGIDYNINDLTGAVQQQGADVRRAIEAAVRALMRTNVSLYAIDPRALSSVETTSDGAAPATPASAPRVGSPPPRFDFSEPTEQNEFAASIHSLRNLSESTGGFAVVDTNDMAGAFGRIVEESSDYYILGFTPSKPPKPGEYRSIKVRVLRPDVRVIARKGYMMTAAPAASTQMTAVSEPAFPSVFSRGRPPAAMTPPADTRVESPKAIPGPLAALLRSPLPAAGLPLRVQAVPFSGKDRKASVQLLIELPGSSLAFAESGGRFEERVEVATLTVDEGGRPANGRFTGIDLRLTAEEYQRVKSTGLRWFSQLPLAPGRYQLRIAARAMRTAVSGLVTADLVVPDFDARASLSGVTLTSLPAVLMVSRGEHRLATALQTPPTAVRQFVTGDQVRAAVEAYVPRPTSSPLTLTAQVQRPDGTVVVQWSEQVAPAATRAKPQEFALTIDTQPLAAGRYLLRIALDGARDAERVVPFEIVKNASR